LTKAITATMFLLTPAAVQAWPAEGTPAAGNAGSLDQQLVAGLLALIVIMLLAKVGAELFERLGQPAVLGELTVGILLSGVGLAGVAVVEGWKHSAGLHLVAEVGVILLLFEVGLESHLNELLEVGWSALLVAVVGVIAPVVLGYGVSAYFLAGEPWYVHLFVGGTLAATSVGITARVLKDLNKLDTKEARIILGAAVVDDVLGLIILAVISGLVTSVARGGGAGLSAGAILVIILKAVLFLSGAIFIGRLVHINAVRAGARFRVAGVPLVIAISFCFALAAAAGAMGLAPIIGAFAAGLVLEPSDYEVYRRRGEMPIESLIKPLSTILTPVFFVMMGLRVDLRAFISTETLAFAGVVTLVAILGKQACSLGVLEKDVRIGARLVAHGEPVFSANTVSAMVVMVVLTTLVTPPVLKKLLVAREP